MPKKDWNALFGLGSFALEQRTVQQRGIGFMALSLTKTDGSG